MTIRMTCAQYKAIGAKKKNKYNNAPVTIDNIRWPSKVHGDFYKYIKLRQQIKDIKYFLYEVPIRLPGKVKLIIDFMIFENDDTVEYIDIKGVLTPSFIIKKKLVEALYPIKIKCIYRGDF